MEQHCPLLPEDLILAEDRTSERDKKRIMEGKVECVNSKKTHYKK